MVVRRGDGDVAALEPDCPGLNPSLAIPSLRDPEHMIDLPVTQLPYQQSENNKSTCLSE